MPLSVQVRDYYENDDNGLWSWYLQSLRKGDFEELVGNQLKISLFKLFLRRNLQHNHPVQGGSSDEGKKILFISIPDDVHQDISILEILLRDYFHLEDLKNVEIHKLTETTVYNHENHYLLVDNVNNFEDPLFLELTNNLKRLSTQNSRNTTELPAISKYSSSDRNSSADDLLPQKTHVDENIPLMNTTDRASQNAASIDNASGIVLDFKTPHSQRRIHTLDLLKSASAAKYPYDNYSPNQSEVVSVASESCVQDQVSKNCQVNSSSPLDFEHDIGLTRQDANNYDEPSFGRESIYGDSVSASMVSVDYSSSLGMTNNEESLLEPENSLECGDQSTEYGEGCLDSDNEDGTCVNLSISPCISIDTSIGSFRLVLQSIVLQNIETDELFTGVRQSNNKPAVASVTDDWLLYDADFSMDNLQILTLQDLLSTNDRLNKVLFYTMVKVNKGVTIQESEDRQLSRNSKPLVKQTRIAENGSIDNFSISSLEPTSRTKSNITAHRSIKTIHTTNDWDFRRQNTTDTHEDDYYYIGDDESDINEALAMENSMPVYEQKHSKIKQGTKIHFSNADSDSVTVDRKLAAQDLIIANHTDVPTPAYNNGKIEVVEPKRGVKPPKTSMARFKSSMPTMHAVERSISLPVPNLKVQVSNSESLKNMDDGSNNKSWRFNMRRLRSLKSDKSQYKAKQKKHEVKKGHPHKNQACTIM